MSSIIIGPPVPVVVVGCGLLSHQAIPLLENTQGNTGSLKELGLSSNKLTDAFTADAKFRKLGKLKRLKLSGNQFENFPLDQQTLDAFKNTLIDLSDNESLRSFPQSAISSAETLKTYLDDLRSGSSPLVHMKVMMVGGGGARKASWCRAVLLDKDPFFAGMMFLCCVVSAVDVLMVVSSS